MRGFVLIAFLLILTSVGGCIGGGGKTDHPIQTTSSTEPTPTGNEIGNGTNTTSPTPSPTPNATSPSPNATQPPPTNPTNATTNASSGPAFHIDYTDVPMEANYTRKIHVAWRVTSTDANSTGTVGYTAINYGNQSVPDNETNRTQPYPKTVAAKGTPASPPHDFEANVSISDPGVYYFRANATVGNQTYWAAEWFVNVTEGTSGKVVNVTIGSPGAGAASQYGPSPITVTLGDAVRWVNEDTLGDQHTATSDEGAPAVFDTGLINESAASQPIVFAKVGTYDYHCEVHPDTMSGQVVVKPA